MMELARSIYNKIHNCWREFAIKRPRSAVDDENSSDVSPAKRIKQNNEVFCLDSNKHYTPQGRQPLRNNTRKILTEMKMSQINERDRLSKSEDVRRRQAVSHELFMKSHAAASSSSWKSPATFSSASGYLPSVQRRPRSSTSSSKDLREKDDYNQLLLQFVSCGQMCGTSFTTPIHGSPDLRPRNYQDLASLANSGLVKNVAKTNEVSFNPWVGETKSKTKRCSVGKLPCTSIDLTHDDESSEDISIEYEKIRSRTPRSNSLANTIKAERWTDPTFSKTMLESWRKQVENATQKINHEEEKKKIIHTINEKVDDRYMEERFKEILKIKEAIIAEPEIEEEPKLPELTPEMEDKVFKAWSCRNSGQVLSEGFGLRITQRDLITLAKLNWLNDEVINFYMNLLMERNKLGKYPKVYAFNTFFYPKLISGGHASLKRWTKKVDIFDHELIVVPVHLGIHWCLSVINFKRKVIDYYDSMGHPNQKCLSSLLQYLKDESMDKKKVPFDTIGWVLNNVKKIPMQMNGSDCGMFSCMFAEYLSRGASITFSQEDMPYFRKKMAYEILTQKLLEFK